MQCNISTYRTYAHAELTLGWPVQSRGLDLPLLNTELVVSLHWWGCQQLPVHPARSRVMDCIILCCWHCSIPEGWVPPTPTSLSFFSPVCLFSSFPSAFHCLFKLFSIISVLSPDMCQISSLKPLLQQQCDCAHAVHFFLHLLVFTPTQYEMW